MTSEQIQPQPVSNEILRLLIREAVEREVATQIAHFRQQQQINEGSIRQLNRDVASLQQTTIALDGIIRGNPSINLEGILDRMKKIDTKIGEISHSIDSINDRWLAIQNQISGARKVLYAVGLIASIPGLQLLGKIFGILP